MGQAPADDLDRHRQVANHGTNDGELLVVLLAKDGDGWLNETQETGDHGGHPLKVRRARATTEPASQLTDFHMSAVFGGVEVLGHEETVDSVRSALLTISLEILWV